ncbi:hypothetical protein HYPBUDRAFT_153693 [Hyphopichia burtonii NRRL Y-1933]|uniref:Uncharacterized protein n=1 Tax=Hyphopichia burtonii NRRL Y-1933 TaxID=984485 RepID=A0A1E4RG62_9ASCO|nr:hypothetical protein HYPBUDRAFT_153693 [Hyphopichia burtonii NRRL Y-1933]ODV66249.1 hypothetical protein HYPBUDRAFT_153693 [Hyphopichia burtonii NRRL Y-1933]
MVLVVQCYYNCIGFLNNSIFFYIIFVHFKPIDESNSGNNPKVATFFSSPGTGQHPVDRICQKHPGTFLEGWPSVT